MRRDPRWRERCSRLCGMVLLCLWLVPVPGQARCDIRPAPRSLGAPQPQELLLATQNLWRLSDARTDSSADRPLEPAYLDARLDAVARYLGETLAWPHLVAVQEVEHLALLEELAARVQRAGGPRYETWLVEGLDPSGIDVGLLARDPVRIGRVTDLFRETKRNRAPLFSRPPLLVEVLAPMRLQLLVVHLRSGRDLLDERKGRNVRGKRRAQAEAIRSWMRAVHAAGEEFVVLGDLNSSAGDEAYGEVLAILEQTPVWSAWELLPDPERFSYVHQCRPQAIDNILLSDGLRDEVVRAAASRGNAGYQHHLYRKRAPWLVSDHDGLGVYLRYGPGDADRR